MAKKEIFRKVSLERLSSPEQLDQLMEVTSPKGWIALLSILGLLAIALFWGFWGNIPTSAGGQGIILRGGGVSAVVSAGSGQVEEILVRVGQVVRKGQVVARVRQEGIERQITDSEARIDSVKREIEDLERFMSSQEELSESNENQRRANLTRSIATAERQLEILRENLAVQKELLADGLVTQQTVLSSEQEVNRVGDRLASYRLELSGLELTRLEGEQQLQQQRDSRLTSLRELELERRELQARLEERVQVLANEDGRVLELRVDRGDVISPGTRVLTMEVVSEELMAVLFVPAEMGKQVIPGMEARVTPTTVKPEEHGFILGEVQWVAEFPSTSSGMRRLLGNDDLVGQLMATGPPIQIDVKLAEDPATVTGFKWSSSRGPDLTISSGTLAIGGVIVKANRPIDLVIPTVRRKLGV
ncbi:MAG: NHLP bacteriocin system secretion protein [Acidobacteriota bacterium]